MNEIDVTALNEIYLKRIKKNIAELRKLDELGGIYADPDVLESLSNELEIFKSIVDNIECR